MALLPACKSSKPVASSSSSGGQVVDSIGAYRPVYEAPPATRPAPERTPPKVNTASAPPPTQHNTKEVNVFMDSLASQNRKLELAQGYRVMVYTGNNRDEANKVKERVYKLLPHTDVYVIYDQPTFRIKAGDFLTKLEAEMALARLKKEYAGALIIKDQVSVRPR